jgi:hypothetical protein
LHAALIGIATVNDSSGNFDLTQCSLKAFPASVDAGDNRHAASWCGKRTFYNSKISLGVDRRLDMRGGHDVHAVASHRAG